MSTARLPALPTKKHYYAPTTQPLPLPLTPPTPIPTQTLPLPNRQPSPIPTPPDELGIQLGGSESVYMVWVIPFRSPVAELNQWLGTQKLSGINRSAQTRPVNIKSPCIHHPIQLWFIVMTMCGLKLKQATI